VAPIVVMAVVTYYLAFKIEAGQGAVRRRWFWAGLLVPVLGLVFYKYRVFFIDNLALWAPALKDRLGAFAKPSPMPLAISFFTFEFVHYLVEVDKGAKPIRNPFQFTLFCIYFPSIVSGPIKRYQDFCPQVEHGIARPKGMDAAEGLGRVLVGFFKKMVVADNAVLLLSVLEAREAWTPLSVAALIALQSIRIVFDFSGYSDIAIGLSRMVGLRLPENFNLPYLALNPSDFWRRWHMSLSSWIRDYLYIPLGGNRQGALRRVFNSLLAMLICGLWHGAAWNFALWGVYHGLGLAAHAAWRKLFRLPKDHSPVWWRTGLAWAACLAFVCYGWLVFFYPMQKVVYFTKILLGIA
jgi:alginate O-acetyltransferase complex protein AlgI